MSVKPILFNTAMVKAILDGRKTVTRRMVKLPSNITRQEDGTHTICTEGTVYKNQRMEDILPYLKKPYNPGDILYVRETWFCPCDDCDEPCVGCIYGPGYRYKADYRIKDDVEKWKPSIHMPKEAARIWLKVTDVRVERLNEMTASESAKEGISLPKEFDTKERAYILAFADLWDSTIKKTDMDEYGWYGNPWVWRIEFERCEKPESEE
jgi:hypothetical protein